MDANQGSQPPIAGLILVAVVLSSVFFIDPPLHGSRPQHAPKISDIDSSGQSVPARLWQDPLEAISLFQQRSDQDTSEPVEANHRCKESFKQVMGVTAATGDDIVKVLLVMTPGSYYTEDSERRMRARYAVISALGVNEYYPIDSQHIDCVQLKTESTDNSPLTGLIQPGITPEAIFGRLTGSSRTANDRQDTIDEYSLPFEWFEKSGDTSTGRQKALVVWVPEEIYAPNPVLGLNELSGKIKRYSSWPSTRISVIGPQTSGTLRYMAMELMQAGFGDFPHLEGVSVYSPSATVDESVLLRGPDGKGKYESVAKLFDDKLPKSGPFIKTTVPDTQTSRAIIKELELRGLDFKPDDDQPFISSNWFKVTEQVRGIFDKREICKEKFGGHRDHVVLVSEQDTLFGRQYPRAFYKAMTEHISGEDNKQCSASKAPGDNSKKRPGWIHRFSYLRGLDGQVPAKIQAVSKDDSSKKPKRNSMSVEEVRRAAGTQRFDYLRRLANRMQRLDHALARNYCGSIKAIGVLGSDVYDKLLILQALREKFPNALFFTADMDTRYLHPAEFNWTRNLIVASSLGLELDARLWMESPPFRDSYQTSRFLATYLAMGDGKTGEEGRKFQKMVNRALGPYVWEIGRTSARALRALKDSTGQGDEQVNSKSKAMVALLRSAQEPGRVSSGDIKIAEGSSQGKTKPQAEFGANEAESKSLVQPIEEPLNPLVSPVSPGVFKGTGMALAVLLFGFGAAYYVRNYFGLHPIDAAGSYLTNLVSPDKESRKDDTYTRTIAVIIMLWLTAFMLGIHSSVILLFIGIAMIFIVVLGRFWGRLQSNVITLLSSRFIAMVVMAIVVVTALSFVILWIANSTATNYNGEPFSLVEGISMWPGEFIRILAGVLAVSFLAVGIKSLRKGDSDLSSEFYSSGRQNLDGKEKECARKRRVDWCCGEDRKDDHKENHACKLPHDALTDWLRYRFYRSLPERWNSVVFPATVFFLLGCVLIYWVDDFHTPYRGEFVYRFDQSVIFGFMVPAFLLLLFTVIDETSLCVGWVRRLTREFTHNKPTGYFLSGTNGLAPMRNVTERELDEIRARLDAVARRTRRVGNLIVGPFIVLFVILLSQSPYFDNWDIPFGLILTIMISASYAIACAIKLRRVSEDARRKALKELTRHLLHRGGKDEKIEILLKEVREIRDGGFLPWFHQPWLKAILWLLSAFGIMSTQYMSLGVFH